MKPDRPFRDEESLDTRLRELFDARTPAPDAQRLEAESAALWRQLQARPRLPAQAPGFRFRARLRLVSGFVLLLLMGLGLGLWWGLDAPPDDSHGAGDATVEQLAADRVLESVDRLSTAELKDMNERMREILDSARSRSREQWRLGMLDALDDPGEDDWPL